MTDFDVKKAEELEEKYDSGLQTRVIGPFLVKFTFIFSIVFALYHYVTAGTGVPIDYWHMGTHMAGVFVLVFIGFPAIRNDASKTLKRNTWWRYANVPIWDWLLMLAGISAAYYVG
ncbi:TRAP transporter permease, partial [bacterium]|nr:TRAP transporter permease [bacterium]